MLSNNVTLTANLQSLLVYIQIVLYIRQTRRFSVLARWNNSTVRLLPSLTHIIPEQFVRSHSLMLHREERQELLLVVIGSTRPAIEHTNHYTTDAIPQRWRQYLYILTVIMARSVHTEWLRQYQYILTVIDSICTYWEKKVRTRNEDSRSCR